MNLIIIGEIFVFRAFSRECIADTLTHLVGDFFYGVFFPTTANKEKVENNNDRNGRTEE